MTYQPLPDCLTIKESEIHGLGLFATENIPKGTNLGIAHILIPHAEETFDQSYYFSHSSSHSRLVTTIMELFTKNDIKKGEEMTSKYLLYKLDEKTLK